MRILWMNHRDIQHPNAGGAERTIIEVAKRLSQQGLEIQLISAGWPGAAAHAEVEGVQVDRFPSYLGPHLALPSILHSTAKPDVVIDDLAHVLPWGSPWLSKVPGTAFFRHLHARTLPGQMGPIGSRLFTGIERAYPLLYKDWTFVTETLGSVQDLRRLGIPSERCRIIKPGVDTSLFFPGTKSPAPRIVYFGGMRKYKRPDHAVRAFARLHLIRADSRLTVLGDGPELPGIKMLAKSLGLGSSIEFLGKVDRLHLAEILSQSHANIHCSTAEGWGYSLLEAAAAGVPTIAYRVPGLTESMQEGKSGLLVDPGDPVALASGLSIVLEDASRWARTSREFAERFDWEDSAVAWRTHLQSVVT